MRFRRVLLDPEGFSACIPIGAYSMLVQGMYNTTDITKTTGEDE